MPGVADRRSTVLLEGPLVRIFDVSCRAPRSSYGDEEWSGEAQVVIPRRGVFELRRGREPAVVDTNTALVLGRDEPYRVGHPASGGDECTVLVFAAELLEEALGSSTGRRGPLEPCIQLALHLLRRTLVGAAADPLEAEEEAVLVLGALSPRLATEAPAHPAPRRRPRPRAAQHARALLASRPTARWRLDALAAAVHSSPYHLARQFRAATGETVSRYLLRLRLGLALERMAAGEAGGARLAAELGFAHQSHFGARFRSFFGVTPGTAREALTRPRLGAMRKIVTARSPVAPYARGHGDPTRR
jgi:AraC family transcriptional regulator